MPSSVSRSERRCRWPLTRRNCLPASTMPGAPAAHGGQEHTVLNGPGAASSWLSVYRQLREHRPICPAVWERLRYPAWYLSARSAHGHSGTVNSDDLAVATRAAKATGLRRCPSNSVSTKAPREREAAARCGSRRRTDDICRTFGPKQVGAAVSQRYGVHRYVHRYIERVSPRPVQFRVPSTGPAGVHAVILPRHCPPPPPTAGAGDRWVPRAEGPKTASVPERHVRPRRAV